MYRTSLCTSADDVGKLTLVSIARKPFLRVLFEGGRQGPETILPKQLHGRTNTFCDNAYMNAVGPM